MVQLCLQVQDLIYIQNSFTKGGKDFSGFIYCSHTVAH